MHRLQRIRGRRARQRQQQALERVRAPRDRMARVQISDEMWAAYRASLGSVPVSVALGRLVEREVGRHRRRTAIDADAVHEAVEDARGVAQELVALITRLELSHGPTVGGEADENTAARSRDAAIDGPA